MTITAFGGENKLFFITREETVTDVAWLDNYTESWLLEGVNASTESMNLPISVSELEELFNLEVTILSGKKARKLDLKDYLSTSTMDWDSFFTGSITYTIQIPPECSFTATYDVKGTHTIFLSKVRKKGSYGALSALSVFNLPDGLVLSTSAGQTFSGPGISFDTTLFADNKAVYYLIHPKAIAATDYFSNWFNSRIEPLMAIRPELLPASLQELDKTGTREQLAAACFQYVQREIRYVAIENGVNAIVPRPAEQVLQTKLGDCKDMANLLVSLLRHFKFDAWQGISRTSSLKDTFDFPAVAMANHMIAVLKLNDQHIFLDATEDDCFFGDPSFQILGTEVFLLNNKAQYFLPVPATLKHPAKVRCEYDFRQKEQKTIVAITLSTSGKLNSLFSGMKRDQKATAKDLSEVTTYLFGTGCTVDSIAISDTSSTIRFTRILPAGSLNIIGTKTYADLSFLPDPGKISRVFSGYEQAKFPAPFEFTLVGITPPNQLNTNKPEQVAIEQSVYLHLVKITFHVGEKIPEPADQLDRYWKSLFGKPILLNP